MKYKLLLFIFIYVYSNAQTSEEFFKKAQEYENNNNHKKAMEFYKKAYIQKNKVDKLVNELNKKDEIQTFTKIKKEFYAKKMSKSDDPETKKTIEQVITSDFELYPYKKNYLMPVTYDLNERGDRQQFETKFQFSVEKPISYDFFGLDETISFAYTQKSFWQTSQNSSPFRETNYQPEIFALFPYENSDHIKAYKVSLIHESNGRNNEFSRSWNRIYFETYLKLSNLFIIPKVWYRIPEKVDEDDNPDIDKYLGYGDLTFFYPYKKHIFELKLRNNLRLNSQNKGSAQVDWTFPLPYSVGETNSFGFIQIFSGYGESLIDYDKEINKIGFGIALSR